MTLRVVDQTGDDELGDRFAKRVEAAVSQTRSAKVIAGKLVKALEHLDMRAHALLRKASRSLRRLGLQPVVLVEATRSKALPSVRFGGQRTRGSTGPRRHTHTGRARYGWLCRRRLRSSWGSVLICCAIRGMVVIHTALDTRYRAHTLQGMVGGKCGGKCGGRGGGRGGGKAEGRERKKTLGMAKGKTGRAKDGIIDGATVGRQRGGQRKG